MKLIIDIPYGLKDVYEHGNVTALDVEEMKRALQNAIPIPDNATNGDVIKALFPTADISLNDSCFEGVVNKYGFDMKWWNSPYQKGVRNDNNKNV